MKKDTEGYPNVSMISKDTVVKGEFHTKSDLRIAGTMECDILAENKCILADTGEILGDLRTKDADIAGKVIGELVVSDRLVLRSTAVVRGDIATRSLMVEEGALIEGACHMGDKIDLKKYQRPSNYLKRVEKAEKAVANI